MGTRRGAEPRPPKRKWVAVEAAASFSRGSPGRLEKQLLLSSVTAAAPADLTSSRLGWALRGSSGKSGPVQVRGLGGFAAYRGLGPRGSTRPRLRSPGPRASSGRSHRLPRGRT